MAPSTRSGWARLAVGLAGLLLVGAAAPPLVGGAAPVVETLLARPLFSPGRRAQSVAPGRVSEPVVAALPRFAGTIVVGGERRALFAPGGAGRPIVVGEGGVVSGFRVVAIAPGVVTIAGVGGVRILRASFDGNRPEPAAPPPLPSYGLPAILPPAQAVILPLNTLPLLPGTPDRAFPTYSAAIGSNAGMGAAAASR